MNIVEQAVQFFNEGNFVQAENLALKVFEENNDSVDAVDILSAIFLRTKNLNFFVSATKKDLDLIRKIAVFIGDLKMFEYAALVYKKALELEPHDAIGLNNLALLYEEMECIQESEDTYKKSIKVEKNYPAIYNLGVLYRKLKNLEESKKYLKIARSMNPENAYANYSLGMTYLMEKDFSGYEYFVKKPVKDVVLQNKWDGSIQKNKTILVFCEYGLGDAIMFSRYFPMLKNYFEKVIVCVKPQLHSIFKNSFENIEFVNDINSVSYDCSVFAMDLPYYLKLDFNNIPSAEGYLKADENKVQEYKQKYFSNNCKKIGIFFVGGELQKRNAKYRAVPLVEMASLFDKEDVKFYSFQKEDIFDELKDYPDIVDLGKTFDDFSDTAAAMKNLDMMITIDSSPVHLAGALGIKTLLLLPYYSEWRWFLDEKNTPWYSSVELVRQKTPCDWQSVFAEIYNEF